MEARELRFGVLGALEVHRGGVGIPVSSPRQRSILATLLARAGRPTPPDVLIEAAWADDLPQEPRAALSTVLSRLRGTLGTDAIQTEPTGYLLAVEPGAVDAAQFEDLLARAQETTTEQAVGLLESALDLWRGQAYEEFADRDFAAAEATRLNELCLSCREELAERYLDLGHTEAAVVFLETLVSEHPLRERALGLSMTALYRAGRSSAALDRYQGYRRSLADHLGLEPSPPLQDLELRILNHDLSTRPVDQETIARAMPWLATDTSFVGRELEVTELTRLAAQHHLVTVTGVGGVGKTRLVAETLPALAGAVRLQPIAVELSGVGPAGVDTAVASALEVGSGPGGAREVAVEYLSVTPALLVLDNCEHVLAELRPLVQEVLWRCPTVRIVATSRRRIGIPAEQVLPLDPLPVPESDVTTTVADQSPSVRLFTDRARRVQPDFTLAATTASSAVADICRRLDGLPLAIELAAMRAASLGVKPLQDRLDRSLDLLSGHDHTPEGSLRATLESSHDLLSAPEQTLFAALAVFEGDFNLQAAESVAVGLDPASVAVSLASLVDASLVTTGARGSNTRYRLLEMVRAFAREQLTAAGLEDDARRAHARWVRLLVQEALPKEDGDNARSGVLTDEATNIQSAVVWALRAGQPQLAGEISGTTMLILLSRHGSHRADLVELARQVAADPSVSASSARALATAASAFAATLQGDLETANRMATAALGMAATAEERYLSLLTLGILTLYRGEYDRSRSWVEQLLATEGLRPYQKVAAYVHLALVACYQRDLGAARRLTSRATALADTSASAAQRLFARYALGETLAVADPPAAVPILVETTREADQANVPLTAGLAETALVAITTRQGQHAEALEVFDRLLDRWLRLGLWPQMWTSLRILAELLADNDEPETAALLLEAAARHPSAPAVTGDDAERYRSLIHSLRRGIDAESLDDIEEQASLLPRAQIVDRARTVIRELRERM